MATITKSSGRNTYLGWAAEDEAAPGVPVPGNPIQYTKMDPAQTGPLYKPKRTVVEETDGSEFVESDVVDEDGTVEGDVAFSLRPDWGMSLLFLACFKDTATGTDHAGVLSHPKPVTLYVMRAGQLYQLAGQFCTKVKISSNGKSKPMTTLTFSGLVKPVLLDPVAQPLPLIPAQDYTFAWKDFSSATLLAGGANQTSLDTFELDITDLCVPFYGNASPDGLPTDFIPTAPKVEAKTERLFKSIAEYTRFADDGQTPAPAAFGWSRGSGAALRSVQFSMPNAVYTALTAKTPLRGPITEEFTIKPLSSGGAAPLLMGVHNTTSGNYTTT